MGEGGSGVSRVGSSSSSSSSRLLRGRRFVCYCVVHDHIDVESNVVEEITHMKRQGHHCAAKCASDDEIR